MESVSTRRRTRGWLLLAIAGCLICGRSLPAQATIPNEYDVRAAIILNLARFVVWPSSRTADPGAPFVVGLLGFDEQSAALEQILSGRSVNGRHVAVRRLAHGDRVSDCFLVYIASPERKHYEELEADLVRAGVLTVSDDERFVYSGGIVGLPVSGDHIEIQVNLAHAQLSGLTISSRLLQLATVVDR